MPAPRRNLELKVRVDDLGTMLARARELGARDEGTRRDVDTYFVVTRGRLKLRQSDGRPDGTVIAYRRADTPGSRYSHYRLVEIADGAGLLAALDSTVGTRAVVVKERHLFIHGATRIHLDRVEGLGSFVELETVLTTQAEAEAAAEHDLVKRSLGLDTVEPVPVSYVDLLDRRG